jgi:hypothetical protein
VIRRKPPLPDTPARCVVRLAAVLSGGWFAMDPWSVAAANGNRLAATFVCVGGMWFLGEFLIECAEMVRERLVALRRGAGSAVCQQPADERLAPRRLVDARQRPEPRHPIRRG